MNYRDACWFSVGALCSMVVVGGCGRDGDGANDGAGGGASSNMARNTGSIFALGLKKLVESAEVG